MKKWRAFITVDTFGRTVRFGVEFHAMSREYAAWFLSWLAGEERGYEGLEELTESTRRDVCRRA